MIRQLLRRRQRRRLLGEREAVLWLLPIAKAFADRLGDPSSVDPGVDFLLDELVRLDRELTESL